MIGQVIYIYSQNISAGPYLAAYQTKPGHCRPAVPHQPQRTERKSPTGPPDCLTPDASMVKSLSCMCSRGSLCNALLLSKHDGVDLGFAVVTLSEAGYY